MCSLWGAVLGCFHGRCESGSLFVGGAVGFQLMVGWWVLVGIPYYPPAIRFSIH